MRLLLALVLIALPVEAAEQVAEREIHCNKEWCFIEKQSLLTLLEGLKKLGAHAQELRDLCGWRDK